jgi:hypothetical protein
MTINPLVAARLDAGPSAWAGVWVAEDIEVVAQGVRDRSWVDGGLGVAGAGLDGLALVSDPVGALLQYGVAWLIEHVKPLSAALDWLAGDPAAITAQASTWQNVATSLSTSADDLARAAHGDLPEWTGAAATAYRAWAAARELHLRSLSRAADILAAMVTGAGTLISAVRLLIGDAVATVVSRLITYAGELLATAGLATPVVVEQVTALCASWTARISRWLRQLLASLARLRRSVTELADLLTRLKATSAARDAYRTPANGTAEYARRQEELAKDPATGGKVRPKNRREADVALDLERRGELPGPIRRAQPDSMGVDQGDFVDSAGVYWDVKGPCDIFPSGPREGQPMPPHMPGYYDGATMERAIQKELDKGQNVILDTKYLTSTSAVDLRRRVGSHPAWQGRVRFH